MIPQVLTDSQIRVLAIIPSVVAPISLVGSVCIVYKILRQDRPNKKASTYLRLMIAQSLVDIVTSSWFMLGPLPVLEETTGKFGARGNTATCSALGFFTQLGVSSVFYNASLLLYFLLKIRYKVKDDYLSKWIEPWMHIISILVPLIQASSGVALGLFNPAGLGLTRCYIIPYPPMCNRTSQTTCQRGELAPLFLWLYCLIPVGLLYLFLNYAIFQVWWTVRHRSRATERRFSFSDTKGTLKAVERQSILYAIVFFNTFSWMYVLIFVEALAGEAGMLKNAQEMFPIQVLGETFFPSQGFFNLIIFVHPRFRRLRLNLKDRPIWWICWVTVFSNASVESLQSSSEQFGMDCEFSNENINRACPEFEYDESSEAVVNRQPRLREGSTSDLSEQELDVEGK